MTRSGFNANRCLPPACRRRGGFVLVAVLVVVMLSSMVAMSLLFRMRADNAAAAVGEGSEQAWAAAMSGVEEAIQMAAHVPPGGLDWQDAPQLFKDQLVYADGSERWYFTVYSQAAEDSLQEFRYGLTDEAGKVNVNSAHSTNLMRLPGMTGPLTEALRDYIDADAAGRSSTGEQGSVDGAGRRRVSRNGSLDTLDELLLVRGFTPALLYGEDANMNWRLDPNEQDGDERFPPDNGDTRLEAGLRQLTTVSSYDPNEDNDGAPRTRLQQGNAPLPGVELPPGLTNYIAAVRSNHLRLEHAADLLEGRIKVKDAFGRESEVASGVGKAELPLVLDLFTASGAESVKGLINVNTAPARVLATVPGIDETLAEAIVSTRRGLSPEKRASVAWLYSEGVVDAPLFRQLAPFLTARSFQFSFHVVGYGLPSGRYRVLDVILDVASGKPRVAYLRDITRLGLPFPLLDREVPDA